MTRDVTTAALASLTVAASEHTLTMEGVSLDGAALTLAGDLAIAEATTLTTLTALEGEGTLKLMTGVTVTARLGEGDTQLHEKKIDIASGATLVVDANGGNRGEEAKDYTGITGTGKIEFKNTKGNQWFAHPTKPYAPTLTFVHNVDMPLSHDFVTTPLTVRNLQGSGNFRFDYGNKNSGTRVVKTVQTEATIWAGTYSATSDGRSFKLVVASDAATPSMTKMLTLSATNTNEQTLEVEATGAINVTGKWTGSTTIAGLLTGSGTINGAVTFTEGAVVVADGQALTLGAVTAESTFVEVTATLDTVGAAATVFTATNDFDETKFSTSAAYVLEKTSTTVDDTTTYALVVKRASTVTVTGTNTFNATTQQVLSDLVVDTLKEKGVTSGTYAVEVEVYTKGSETPKTPMADEVDALLGCFVNVETVEIEDNTATVKIEYEFGLAGVTVDAKLNVIFTATVEGPSDDADYVDGVTFTITDEGTQETWEIGAKYIDFNAPVGTVYLTLPDAYEVEGVQKSVLTDFIGTRQFKVKVRK